MNYISQDYLDNLIISVNFPIKTKSSLQLRDIFFYNKAVDLQDIFPLHSLVKIMSPDEANNYSFIVHNQHLFLDPEKMNGENIISLIKNNSLQFFETEIFSQKNNQMILNIAMIHGNIDLITIFINKNIFPNPKHHSLFKVLLTNDRTIEIVKLLEEKKFPFDYTLFSYLFKQSLFDNNKKVFNYLINKIEKDDYLIYKTFFDFFVEKNINQYRNFKNKEFELFIEKSSPTFSLLLQKLSHEKFESIIVHSINDWKKEGWLKEKLEQYHFNATLEYSLTTNSRHSNKTKL